MSQLQWGVKKRPREASTSGVMADHLQGGVDMSESICSVSDCDRTATSRGWCQPHYARWYRHGDPLAKKHASATDTVLDRILARVDIGDCWLWQGAVSPGGYGRIGFGGSVYQVHRVMWEELVGPIPAGHEIDHLCRVRHCVNPDHLEPVTKIENIRRGFSVPMRNAKAEVCVNGHPFDEQNTYHKANGHRICRACRNMHEKRRRARLKGEQ